MPRFAAAGYKLSSMHAQNTLRMGFTSQRQACPAGARGSSSQAHLRDGPLGADIIDVALPRRPGQAVLCCHLPPGSLLHGSSVGNHILPAPVRHHQVAFASLTSQQRTCAAGLVAERHCVAWGSEMMAPARGFFLLLTIPPACVGAMTVHSWLPPRWQRPAKPALCLVYEPHKWHMSSRWH